MPIESHAVGVFYPHPLANLSNYLLAGLLTFNGAILVFGVLVSCLASRARKAYELSSAANAAPLAYAAMP